MDNLKKAAREYWVGKIDAKKLIPAALVSVAVSVALNLLIGCLRLSEIFPAYQSVEQSLYSLPLAGQLFRYCLLMPALEELIFRGLIYVLLRQKLSEIPSVIISAVLFGLYHGNVVQFIYTFILGILFAEALEKRRNMAVPFIMHSAANLASVLLTYFGFYEIIFH